MIPDSRIGRIAALLLTAATMPAHAQSIDRARLDRLIVAAEATDSAADPDGYHAAFVAALAEAERLYPAGHPEIAARRGGLATALAATSKFDEAMAMAEAALPTLEKAGPGYRKEWLNVISTIGYVHNFKGNHAAALDAFSRDVAARRAGGDAASADFATSLSNLAAAKWESAAAVEALALNAEAIAMASSLKPVPNDIAVWYANRAMYQFSSGRADEAIATSRTGLAASEAVLPPDHPLLSNLLANLAAMLTRQGRPSDALPIARRAFELVEKAAGKPTQNSATMRVMFANALMETRRYAEAETFLSAASPIIDAELGATSDRALLARENRAVALLRLGRAREARGIQNAVLAVRDARFAPGHRDRMNGRVALARIALAEGDLAGAETALAEAVALREQAVPASHPDLLAERAMLLMVRSRAGRTPAPALAADAATIFAALVENARYELATTSTTRDRAAFGGLAEVLLRAGDVDGAFEAQQWAARTSVDDAVASATATRAAASDPVLSAKLADRRKLLVERGALFAAIQTQLQRPDPAFKLADTSAKLADVAARLRSVDTALGADGVALQRFRSRSLAQVRAGLGDGDVFLLATDLGDHSGIIVATRSGQTGQLAAETTAVIRARVQRVRATLTTGATERFATTDAGALHTVLIGSRAAPLLRGKTRLMVSANGALSALPFGVLMPDARTYLIDRIAVARLPGVPSGQASPSRRSSAALFAMGDVGVARDGLTRIAMRSGSDARTIGDLPHLPAAGAELAEIARVVGAETAVILTGAHATEASLRDAKIPAGAVVAFATHGLVSGELEGLREPALVLTAAGDDDGLLTATEISAMTIPADWVILSACNTAAGAGPDAPGLSGLAQAFILAGSSRILATHWPVRDDIARAISVGTLRAAAAGAEPAEALRRAILDVRRGGAIRDGAQPSLWAAFELIAQ